MEWKYKNERLDPRYGIVKSLYIEYQEEDRLAYCDHCKCVSKSHTSLPFFKETNKEYDYYYCGCRGWD